MRRRFFPSIRDIPTWIAWILAVAAIAGGIAAPIPSAHMYDQSLQLGCHCWLIQPCFGLTATAAKEPRVATAYASARSLDSAPILALTLYRACMTFLAGLYAFSLGATLGSFANVVVYRLPRGRNVVYPGSACPVCGHAIRGFDNIPILSWLILRGRCRDCGTAIAPRYFFVELTLGLAFLLLFAATYFSGGADLPFSARSQFQPGDWTITGLDFGLITISIYHGLLTFFLLCSVLIAWDGHRIPASLLAVALAVGIVFPLLFRGMHPLGLLEPNPWPEFVLGPVLTGPAIALVGAAAGFLIGLAISWIGAAAGTSCWDQSETVLSIVGAYLGWQATLSVAALAVLLAPLFLFAMTPGVARGATFLIGLFPATVIQIPAWTALTKTPSWPGQAEPSPVHILGFIMIAILSWLVSKLSFAQTKAAGSILGSATPSSECYSPGERTPGESSSELANFQAILNSPSYKLAERDLDLLARDELRPVRLQLELLKPELVFKEQGVRSTIVVFGGTQIVPRERAARRLDLAKAALATGAADSAALTRAVERAERLARKSRYYDEAREFARLVTACDQCAEPYSFLIVTGGGPGIMEAANRGAFETGGKSAGLNITLPEEQCPNPYITPELCFQFHYFALRKMHFLLRTKALVVFPGGFGTLDELFDALTLRQTDRMQKIPIVLYGTDYWKRAVDFQFLADEGVIDDADLDLIQFADDPQQAWDLIREFHQPPTESNPTSSSSENSPAK